MKRVSLHTFISILDDDRKRELESLSGCTRKYLYKVARNHDQFPALRSLLIEASTRKMGGGIFVSAESITKDKKELKRIRALLKEQIRCAA